jgi:arylsulfatase A-like enzyme
MNRRDFLRLASIIPAAYFAQPLVRSIMHGQVNNVPNVIVLVFDAWSARHVQLYGYPRVTMPNLEKFAAHATVFHNHYSAGTFTVPGTASLLTGLYPWTHRALSLGSGGILRKERAHNIFSAIAGTHSTVGFAQNKYADLLLFQMSQQLDVHIPAGAFDLEHHYVYDAFNHDAGSAFAALEDNILRVEGGRSSSLFLGSLFRLWEVREREINTGQLYRKYPRGLPDSTEQFLLSDVVDGAIKVLSSQNKPFFSYLHFYPPHDPYRPTSEYVNAFHDGLESVKKPVHDLSIEKTSDSVLKRRMRNYDQYLLSWDAELGRLFDFLHTSGLFDQSYIVITSDHGELFERGESGHMTPLIFDSLIHVPLLIAGPGQVERRDVHAPTSSVDIVPTLLHLTGNPRPQWAEGTLLPLFGGNEDSQRSVYSVDAKKNSSFAPLTQHSISLTKANFRLTYYCYPMVKKFEFYDLVQDREELNDLFPSQPAIAMQMKDELLQKLSEVNKPA